MEQRRYVSKSESAQRNEAVMDRGAEEEEEEEEDRRAQGWECADERMLRHSEQESLWKHDGAGSSRYWASWKSVGSKCASHEDKVGVKLSGEEGSPRKQDKGSCSQRSQRCKKQKIHNHAAVVS